jgi:transposase-like protein
MNAQERADLVGQAHRLYMTGQYTQLEIAAKVGITRRTLFNWIHQGSWHRAHQNSLGAPNLITDNLISSLLELQNTIKNRPEGERFPSPQEMNTINKLLACITRMAAFPTEALQKYSLSVSNYAQELSVDQLQNLQQIYAPYQANQFAENHGKMGNSSPQSIDEQELSAFSQVENDGKLYLPNEKSAEQNMAAELERIIKEDEPTNPEGLSDEEKRKAIQQWFLNRNLFPLGGKRLMTDEGRGERFITNEEWHHFLNYNYTEDDLRAAI